MAGDRAVQSSYPDRAMCLALLAAQPVGRLVVSEVEPLVVPVNFILIGESIIFRVDASSSAARAVGRRVAFEVDQFSELERTGWSVIARGTLERASDSRLRRLEGVENLVSWAAGPKDRWLLLPVRNVTGRWVRGTADLVFDDSRGYL